MHENKNEPITNAQIARLRKHGYSVGQVRHWTRGKAGFIIGNLPGEPSKRPARQVQAKPVPVQAKRGELLLEHVPQLVVGKDASDWFHVSCCYCGDIHKHSETGFQVSQCRNGGLNYYLMESSA